MADNYNLSVAASELNTAITKANAAAPQSTTYTKAQVDAAIAAETTARQSADATLTSSLANVIDSGSKNILKNTATSRTLSGVTFTVNADGSVTVNGTATGSTGLRVVGVQGSDAYADATPIPRGNYVVFPSNTGNPRIRWGMGITTASDAARNVTYIYDTPVRFEVTNDTTRYDFTLAVANGEECSGETLYPMICTAEDYAISPDFVPYTPTLAEMYQMVKEMQGGN